MKTITINITHDEVFKDFVETMTESDSKHITVVKDNNSVTVNITGTLEEMDNE